MKAKVFKVRVKKSNLNSVVKTNIPDEEMFINLFPGFRFSKEDLTSENDTRIAEEERKRRSKERAAIALKACYEYFKEFPDDDVIYFEVDCDGCFVGMYEPEATKLYLWGVESKRHWWEYSDLPKGIFRAAQNYPGEELARLEYLMEER